MEDVSRRYFPMRASSEWGCVGQFSGSVQGEVLYIWPDAKDLQEFARSPTAFNRGLELRSANLYYRDLQENTQTWIKKALTVVKPP